MRTLGLSLRSVLGGVGTWAVSLAAAAAAVLLADHGEPIWLSLLLLVWLATAGLPTTLVVVALAAVWGRVPGAFGLAPFLATAAVAALVAQAVAVAALRRLWGASR